ncbi:MAG: DNA mismatch repair endonuclease MutL [Clostridiales bacterium]|nr:DNA mismatch repair endonuclease MutL [Clostridiales bacterium]
MGRIAVLDQQTIDKIAAGEVVERPASVVKELVENAIDAGASQITVELREGGIDFIRITDNGSGMEKEDIPVAFLRHSTSKIRSVEDLQGVASLGFRGEALSSISAVSMVELITKTRESVLGSRCYLEGGIQKSLEEIGAPDGTTFIIRNLFYNTPARKKFLRTDMTEAAAVHELMTHLALSHPEISFKVIIKNQMKLQTAGSGNLKDVIYHVYGRDVAMRLLPVDRREGPLHITGFIGKPEISRGNRNYENYFVNGRYVKSKIIAKGIEDGYKTFMMQHRYPFVCLDIRIDGKLLDVNVHPTKMELRFSDQNLVYDLIRRTVQDVLSGRELIPEVELDGQKEKPVQEARASREEQRAPLKPVEKLPADPQKQLPPGSQEQVPLEKLWKTPAAAREAVTPQDKNLDYFMAEMRKRVEDRHMPKPPAQEPQMIREEETYSVKPKQSEKQSVPVSKPEQLDLFDGRLLSREAALQHVIIGQLFDTYWLVQFGDKLYIIDQHAAHEKVLYERLMKDLRERTFQSQLLSPPIVLNMTMQEEELYLRYQSCFADMGFEIEEFGDRAYAVRAVPSNLPGVAKNDVLMELMDSLSDISGNISSESLLDKVASMSCKAAVKGNHQMSAMEAKALIDELLTLENPYNCPHGRPTIISMTKYELEKKFKRIV